MASLLLRLFQSSHFDIRLAVSYLKTYPDSIGITHYLISRLNDYPEDELLPFWPQFCHLLLSRATESTALEDFILRKSRQSTHLAMLSLWFLQAALSDLAATPTTSAFATCRRVLNGVQAIIFSDLIAPTQSLSSSSSSSPVASLLGIKPKNKLKPHAKAAVVGLGVLASGLALPQLAQVSGEMVLAQGRRQIDPEYDAVLQRGGPVAGPSRQSSDEEDTVDFAPPAGRRSIAIQNGSERSSVSGRRPPPSRAQTTGLGSDHTNAGPPVSRSATAAARFSSTSVPKARFSADGPKRKALTPVSFTNTPSTSALDRTSSSNASAVAIQRRATASASSLPLPQSQSISVPSLPLKDQSTSGHHHIDVHRALATLPRDALSQLLRAHSCRAQLDLLSSLQDISTRLVNVPKAARVSALRAELTVLNHGLPRGCCVGVLCSHEKADEAHHRVVRISPSESVVLNSADRAPYLIHVEVLEGDLDFDPMRRQNIEDVRHVLQEREEAIAKASSRDMHFAPPSPSNSSQKRTGAASKSTTAGSVAAQTGKAIAQATKGLRIQVMERTSLASADVGELRTPPPAALSSPSVHSSASPFGFDDGDDEPRSAAEEAQRESALREEEGDIGTAAGPSKSQQRTSTEPEEPPEEMDMVEQLYGDTSLIPEPTSLDAPVLHNRSLDEEAWSRLDSDLSAAANSNSAVAPSSPETPAQAHLDRPSTPIGGSNGARKPITLDEYADRMRMAAIMLSQLSAQEADAALLSTASAGMVVGLAGAGLEAVKGRLPFTGSRPPPSSAGQGSTGLPAKMDIDAAASGLSAVQGTAPLSPPTGAATSASATPPQSATAAVPPKSKVLSPAAASAIRERIMNEMQALEEERMSRMRLDSKARASGWTTGHAPPSSSSVDDPNLVLSLASKEDPSGVVLSESWSEKKARIRASSPYGHLERWNVFSVIVKTGTDLRQEQLATQLIREFERIWTASGCPHWIRYFRILVTSESTGLIETITDTMSVHSIKKTAYSKVGLTPGDVQQQQLSSYTLYDHFKETFGPPSSSGFRRAQSCFMKSLASYCIVCYLLQIKDRHNGNILIDRHGHIMHIDFGFLLSNSPGQLGFEMAPFKLPQEYIDILGGLDSERFQDFRTLTKQCFWSVRKHAESIIMIVELMQKDSALPCFSSGDQTAQLLRQRFQLSLSQPQCDEFVDRLIDSSAGSVFTRLYDAFQTFSQGIL